MSLRMPAALSAVLGAILMGGCCRSTADLPADPVEAIRRIVPAEMRIVAVTNGDVQPVYRRKGKGIEIQLLRKSLTLDESKGPDVCIHLMKVPYDDGGVWTDDGNSQTSASEFIGSNSKWQVYVHGATPTGLIETLELTPSGDPRTRPFTPTNPSAETADDQFPISIGTNTPATDSGLHISAVSDQKSYSKNQRPTIIVTFSNQASKPVVILNHFAYTAVGPLFRPLLRNPENVKQYREVTFTEQLSIRKTHPHWIVLKPGKTHRFQSKLYDPLPSGNNSLQVQYRVSGPAESIIAECRKEPACPKDFWRGTLMSNVVEIEVKPATSTPHTVP